jgi:hypothetical protein
MLPKFLLAKSVTNDVPATTTIHPVGECRTYILLSDASYWLQTRQMTVPGNCTLSTLLGRLSFLKGSVVPSYLLLSPASYTGYRLDERRTWNPYSVFSARPDISSSSFLVVVYLATTAILL